MVPEQEIAERLKEILQTADLTTTTTASIRRKLEEELGIDLTNKKAFIREQVDLYLLQQQQQQQLENNEVKQEDEHDVKEEEESSEQPVDEEEDDEEDEDEESGKRSKKSSSNKEKNKRGTGSGFNKLCGLSPELQSVLGVSELSRTQVVKQLWVYIRENDLQDPQNRRKILCDDKLRPVFRKDSIDMFEMNKVLSNHILRLDDNGNVVLEDSEPKAKQQKQEKKEDSERKAKRQKQEKKESKAKRQKQEKEEGGKAKNSGFSSPLPLSDALVTFLGTGESQLSRAEVVKRIWGYIKDNNLQDPSDKRRIVCDTKLRELFGCDTFNGFGVTKLLTTHFLKT